MSGLEVAGIAISVGQVIVEVLLSLKRLYNARQQVKTIIETTEERVSRICKTIERCKTFGDSTTVPGQVLRRVCDEFNGMKTELTEFKNQATKKRAIRNRLSSQDALNALESTSNRLYWLECHLDTFGLMGYALDTLAEKFRQLLSVLDRAGVGEGQELRSNLEKMMSSLNLDSEVGDGAHIAIAASHSVEDDVVDELESHALDAYSSLSDQARGLIDKLTKSGMPRETREEIGQKIRELWNGWRVDLGDLELKRKRNGDKVLMGAGASSFVYKAQLQIRGRNGRPTGAPLHVAVKYLKIATGDLGKRFPDVLREVFLQMDVGHPCVLKTYGAFWPEEMDDSVESDDDADDPTPLIVMEQMTYNLSKGISKGLLAEGDVQHRVLFDVARGIAHLHSKRVVHRDVKPENVLLRVNDNKIIGHAKISDFGVSRRMYKAELEATYAKPTSAAGTIAYMPPEVLRDVENCSSRRSWDVWGFGVLVCFVANAECRSEVSKIQALKGESMARSGELARVMQNFASKIGSSVLREIAALCLQDNARSRPRMEAVVEMLQPTCRGGTVPGLRPNSKTNTAAQGNLRISSGNCIGLEKDVPKAVKLYKTTGDAGDAVAQRNLGWCYQKGIGVDKDLSKAVALYKTAAHAGDARAQRNLGWCYRKGIGVDKDLSKAAALYETAADAGDAVAQCNLGDCYRKGIGVGKDVSKAVKLYKTAADAGHTVAHRNLGWCYQKGIGVDEDVSKAVALFKIAADSGDAGAQTNLGWCYESGTGVWKDVSKAVKLYKTAADAGDARAQTNLGLCYENGIGVEEDESKAVALYKTAADAGNARAQYNLGWCYEKGIGVEKDKSKAVALYKTAADAGDAHAQGNLGWCYQSGIGVEKDVSKAVALYKTAADAGNAGAQTNLGWCYEKGSGVEKDKSKAVALYKTAADSGNAGAQNNLGVCYENGTGVEEDVSKAVALYKTAADAGNARAQTNLGLCYEDGIGVRKDMSKAVALYETAADGGDADAQVNLGLCYHYGIGVEKDVSKAFGLYKIAADGGNAFARRKLENMRRKGHWS